MHDFDTVLVRLWSNIVSSWKNYTGGIVLKITVSSIYGCFINKKPLLFFGCGFLNESNLKGV